MQVTENNIKQHKSLSIRVCTDGLSFCVYSPTEEESYKYVVYKVKPTISLAANLKAALNSEPILQSDYQRVNVLVTTPKLRSRVKISLMFSILISRRRTLSTLVTMCCAEPV